MQSEKLLEEGVHQGNETNSRSSKKAKIIWTSIAAIALLALVLGLSLGLTLGDDSQDSTSPPSENPQPASADAGVEKTQPTIMSLNQATLAKAVNSFGSQLLSINNANQKPYSAGQDAAFFSPWGIAHALSMLHEGAAQGSASQRQLQEVVFAVPGGGASNDAVRTAIRDLSDDVVQGSNGVNLTVSDANSAWISPQFGILDSYDSALKTFYNAQVSPLNGAGSVNAWVANATNNKITSIIDDDVAKMADLVLINAIYFLGNWEVLFIKDSTTSRNFTLPDGNNQTSPFMYKRFEYGPEARVARFTATPEGSNSPIDCIAVRLPYKGGKYSAIFTMPEGSLKTPSAGGALELETGGDYMQALASCRTALSDSLNAGIFSNDSSASGTVWWKVGDPEMDELVIFVPRFEIEFSTSLVKPLQAAGVTAIFTPGDFTGISAGGGSLAVTDVVHKVYVKVDEQGTEAAAVTGIVAATAMPIYNEQRKEIIVDFNRPFSMFVVDESAGLALFAGEVYRPEEWKTN